MSLLFAFKNNLIHFLISALSPTRCFVYLKKKPTSDFKKINRISTFESLSELFEIHIFCAQKIVLWYTVGFKCFFFLKNDCEIRMENIVVDRNRSETECRIICGMCSKVTRLSKSNGKNNFSIYNYLRHLNQTHIDPPTKTDINSFTQTDTNPSTEEQNQAGFDSMIASCSPQSSMTFI